MFGGKFRKALLPLRTLHISRKFSRQFSQNTTPPPTYGKFRTFLKTLGPGETGFVNGCIGVIAFSFALYQHDYERNIDRERVLAKQAEDKEKREQMELVMEAEFYANLCFSIRPLALLNQIRYIIYQWSTIIHMQCNIYRFVHLCTCTIAKTHTHIFLKKTQALL